MSTSTLAHLIRLFPLGVAVVGCAKQEPVASQPSAPVAQSGPGEPVGRPGEPVPAALRGPAPKVPKEYRETAEALTTAFDKNYAAACQKYADNTVEVTGAFDHVRTNTWAGEPEVVVCLRGHRESGSPSGYARLNGKVTYKQFDIDPRLRSLARGQSVTLRGKAQNNRDASVTDCEVVAVGPSTAIPTTPREIEEEVNKNPGTFGRFKDRDVIVRVALGNPRFTSSVAHFPLGAAPGGERRFEIEAPRLGDAYDAEVGELKAKDEAIVVAKVAKPLGSADTGIVLSEARFLKALPEGVKLPAATK